MFMIKCDSRKGIRDIPKRLRDKPIYLAPEILGSRDDQYNLMSNY